MIWRCKAMEMPSQLSSALGGEDVFEQVMGLEGEVHRDMPGRKTIRVELDGSSYFIKQHFGVGWREILKNLIALRMPIIGAETEWQAIRRLDELGIATTPAIAFGYRGCSPASRQSFVITRDLGGIVSLEDYCRDWATRPPDLATKRRLIREVARIARTLHDNGLNHRDFYLCHFCLDARRLEAGEVYLYLLDLHRMGMHRHLGRAERMKDMAALYFSAMDCGLSERDRLRFIRLYRGCPLREALSLERRFWLDVSARAIRLYAKFQRKYGPGAVR